jgi:hypothetical protein
VAATPKAGASHAPPSDPTVTLGSAALLAPDGRSLTIDVIASCPGGSTVVEASVTISQPNASGTGDFPLACVDAQRSFIVTVRASDNPFELGDAQADAIVRIGRSGRTEQATDSDAVPVNPSVFVDLAPAARLRGGGAAMIVGLRVACPVGASPEDSFVNVGQSEASGQATFLPVCDGATHSLRLTVRTTGRFVPGVANGAAVGAVSFGGDTFITEIVEALQVS